MDKITLAFDSKENSNFFEDMAAMAKILINNRYDVLMRYEDCGIYCMDIAYSTSLNFGGTCLGFIDTDGEFGECDDI